MFIGHCYDCAETVLRDTPRHFCGECGNLLHTRWIVRRVGGFMVYAHGNEMGEIVYAVGTVHSGGIQFDNLTKGRAMILAKRMDSGHGG